MSEVRVEIRKVEDIVLARRAGREMARTRGFGLADQTRIATAISELARNVIQYAGTGVCTITDEASDSEARIHVVVEDKGPGIADIDKAMESGFSSGSGLGAGLPAVKRLVHEFHIESSPGCTKVSFVMTRRRL